MKMRRDKVAACVPPLLITRKYPESVRNNMPRLINGQRRIIRYQPAIGLREAWAGRYAKADVSVQRV